jgi:hypothetical protein
MRPSIADLVPEMFYSRKVFEIDFNTTSILRPPTYANTYIRYLAVRLHVPNAECWDVLITFAATTAAQYPKLRHVTVQFEWRYPEASAEDFMKRVDQGVHHPCPGEAVFVEPVYWSSTVSRGLCVGCELRD